MRRTGEMNPHAATDRERMDLTVRSAVLTVEEERVLEWRYESLARAGFCPDLAFEIAASRDVELHSVLTLVGSGCPPAIAARIVL
jgi:hypothetical protein